MSLRLQDTNQSESISLDIYYLKLREWVQWKKTKSVGWHSDCIIPHGLQSIIPKPSEYSDLRSTQYWRSVCKPKDMVKRMEAYGPRVPPKYDERHERCFSAIERMLHQESIRKSKPLSFRKALRDMPQDTSPGYPLNRMGFAQKRECIGILRRMHSLKKAFTYTHKVETFPCVAGVRNQLCKVPDNKPRLTWVYPLEVALLEGIFALPMFEALKSFSLLAWDVRWFNGGCGVLLSSLAPGNAVFGVDFSGYDASVCGVFIRRAFRTLSQLITFEHKWHLNAWRFLVNYFVEKWIVFYKYGVRVQDGVPSGSFFTQVIDSFVNAAAHLDAIDVMAGRVGIRRRDLRFGTYCKVAKFMGDDSLISLKFPLTCDEQKVALQVWRQRWNLISHHTKGFWYPSFGLSCDDDDQVEPIEFLGKTLISEFDIVISLELLLAQASIPDGRDTAPGDYMTRLIGLAWAKGTDRKQHRLLEAEYKRWSTLGHTPILPRKGEMKALFSYVLHEDFPTLEFPDYMTIYQRYSGHGVPWSERRIAFTTNVVSTFVHDNG